MHRSFLQNRFAGTITANAPPGSLADQALDIFTACYGSETGVLGLKFMPFGGLYLTGGVTNKLLDRIVKPGPFMEAYHDKGRVSPLLQRVPLYVIKAEDCGERGAHLRAVRLMKENTARPHEHLGPEVMVPPRETHISRYMGEW